MAMFECNRSQSLGAFLRGPLTSGAQTYYFQVWRVMELLTRYPGSIVIGHRGVSQAAGSLTDRVARGDQVIVQTRYLDRPLALGRCFDYGTVPRTPVERDGLADDYAVKARGLLDVRPQTCRLGSDNLEAFIRDLLYSNEITQPIYDLFLFAHFSALGELMVPVRDGAERSTTSYEDLLALTGSNNELIRDAVRLRSEIINPRPAAVRAAPATLTSAWGGHSFPEQPWPTYSVDIPCRLHIRGCNAGIEHFNPMLHILKQAINDSITLTATKYFHSIGFLDTSNPEPGYYEWMAYGFKLYRRDAIAGGDAHQRRSGLIDAFRVEAQREGSNLKYYDGSAVDAEILQRWLPSDLDPNNPGALIAENHKERTWNLLINTPVQPFRVPVRFRYRQWSGHTAFTWTISFSSDPGNDRTVLMDALRQSLLDPERSNYFQDDYGFPAYRRYGYASFDEFMDGWNWEFTPWSHGEISAIGTRHEYNLLYPILNRNSTHLVLNFYPLNPSHEPILRLPYTNEFFTII